MYILIANTGDITRLVTNFAELLGWSVDLVQVAESRQTELNEVVSKFRSYIIKNIPQ